MKIERISDNQIRCTLSSFDLSVRNLNLGELAYGSEKARSLFREMIQKASNEVGFEAEDIPLMVEAIPLSNESVMLVITKIEDPEELDTRFSKFSPLTDEEQAGYLTDITNELLEGADHFLGFMNQEEEKATPDISESQEEEKTEIIPSKLIRIYSFNSLDQITDAAKIAGHVYGGDNTLYKKPGTSQYYLVVSNTCTDALEFSRVCNILAEYGTKLHHEYSSEAYYQEHYEVIIQEKALQKLAVL